MDDQQHMPGCGFHFRRCYYYFVVGLQRTSVELRRAHHHNVYVLLIPTTIVMETSLTPVHYLSHPR